MNSFMTTWIRSLTTNHLQRRKKFKRVGPPSSNTLSLLSKELQDAHLQALLGGTSRFNTLIVNVADPILSTLVYNLPTFELEETCKLLPTFDEAPIKLAPLNQHQKPWYVILCSLSYTPPPFLEYLNDFYTFLGSSLLNQGKYHGMLRAYLCIQQLLHDYVALKSCGVGLFLVIKHFVNLYIIKDGRLWDEFLKIGLLGITIILKLFIIVLCNIIVC